MRDSAYHLVPSSRMPEFAVVGWPARTVFPPHLSPFAKVITEVGSGAKRQLGLRALDDADHRDVLGQGQIAGTA
jgi:hypothetical protein